MSEKATSLGSKIISFFFFKEGIITPMFSNIVLRGGPLRELRATQLVSSYKLHNRLNWIDCFWHVIKGKVKIVCLVKESKYEFSFYTSEFEVTMDP